MRGVEQLAKYTSLDPASSVWVLNMEQDPLLAAGRGSGRASRDGGGGGACEQEREGGRAAPAAERPVLPRRRLDDADER